MLVSQISNIISFRFESEFRCYYWKIFRMDFPNCKQTADKIACNNCIAISSLKYLYKLDAMELEFN